MGDTTIPGPLTARARRRDLDPGAAALKMDQLRTQRVAPSARANEHGLPQDPRPLDGRRPRGGYGPNSLMSPAQVLCYILEVNNLVEREALQAVLEREIGPEAKRAIVTAGQQIRQEILSRAARTTNVSRRRRCLGTYSSACPAVMSSTDRR
jgi:hypothetical protein